MTIRVFLAASVAFGLGLGQLPARAQEQVLKYGTSSAAMVAAPLLLSTQDKTIFGKNGLRVEMTDFRGQTANCVVAVISGAVNLCQVGTLSGTDAIADGAPLVAIAATNAMTAELIISQHAAKRLGLSQNATVEEKLKALKGLRVISSAPGTGHYLVLNEMLKTVGLSIADTQYRVLGDTNAMMASLQNDAVDAVLWSIGGLGPSIADGSGIRWISPRTDMQTLADLPYYVVYARKDWVEKNLQTVADIRASLETAVAKLLADPDGSGKAIKQAYFPDMDQAVWDDGFAENIKTFIPGVRVSRKGWDKYIGLYAPTANKSYSGVTYEAVVMPDARSE
ncbi:MULTISPECIES: ABC transporter substrate-binding protein [unclassified Chelatococcus]|uniref:ABC transporter substrate-binding protein n=1 Tax=unclassified Chelatococcus TaxID=2638111 RepID=UPI001BCA8BD8|nr:MULTISPECIES: ABC transporter substrate-binding protein [unclassified Chelatococcus]MBS7700255.1 ABC transporter substrate-binding protein [Chelatococcus sp. YT9]MBX3558226.1 ABC transporter substrate-binding protein [Chelatococcus sp.]